jgi:hypothetical protein
MNLLELANLYAKAAKKKQKRKQKKKERPEMARPFPNPIFRNFDYTDEGPNETSPGGGLYHGPMDKYKSVDDFVTKRRKELKQRRKQLEARRAKLETFLK